MGSAAAAAGGGRAMSGGVGGPSASSAAPGSPLESLESLELRGCVRLGDEAAALLGRLTGLRSLDISETAIRGGGLAALTTLRRLTRLAAGGLQTAGDEAWCGLLPALPQLSHLELWGGGAGGAGRAASADPPAGGSGPGGASGGEDLLLALACLGELRHLSLAWTGVRTLPAFPGLQVLDLRHCRLSEVWWPTGGPGRLALRQLLLAGAEVEGPAAAAGIAQLVRCSAPTLELLDLSRLVAVGGHRSSDADPWVASRVLAALADPWDGDGGADGPGTGPAPEEEGQERGAAAAAPRLTCLDLSHAVVQPGDLVLLQCAPALRRLSAAGTRGGCPEGAEALAAAGLHRLQRL
ncbi:hypothetical protein GPECTOR_39g503 [Gonium pectorale]|uniref:Uncharacterized protein n=1 Tax=Gonium pectorale TaxID=33097 RepID=A0A150GB07_GONPE|nr:hypothetical protein GPECTOR_39g503 [Gonium pectorale]|eukprot:KXZ47009.1 hypothetical protein GPECTOR_39g503 [Gonium pectorale]